MLSALRSLRGRPGAPLAAAGVLAVGVGLATAVFSLGDAYLWRPLPYANPDRLVSISLNLGLQPQQADVPTLTEWQARSDLFAGVAAFADRGHVLVRVADRTAPLRTVGVTATFLEVLGLESNTQGSVDWTTAWLFPRALAQGDELAAGRAVSTVPAGTWHVRSVLPRSFVLPQATRLHAADVLVVMPPGPIATVDRSQGHTRTDVLRVVARLRPGVTPTDAQAALNTSLAPKGLSAAVVSLTEAMVTGTRFHNLARGALFASVFMFLVCCANLTGMALTRGLYRSRKVALMTALGATPFTLARLLIAEAAVIAFAGGIGGLEVAALSLSLVTNVIPAEYATFGTPSLGARSLFFASISASAALLSWSLGSIVAWWLGVTPGFRPVVYQDGRAVRVIRFSLLTAQVAMALVLLAAAGVLGRSYANLLRVDSGMDASSLVLSVSYGAVSTSSRLRDTIDQTVQALRRAPGATAAAASIGGLVDGTMGLAVVYVAGRPARVEWTQVTPDYFAAAGLQFLAGRAPRAGDHPQSVVVNESLARRDFGGRYPIGEALVRGTRAPIIGVVKDTRSRGLSLAPRPSVLAPLAEIQAGVVVTYVVGTSPAAPPGAMDLPRMVRDVDDTAVVLDMTSLGERLGRSMRDRTFAALVMALFAGTTTLVTVVGLTVVVAHVVARRTRESAIRLAIGARPIAVIWLVMRAALAAVACGAALGFVAAVWLARTLESLLFDVPPIDYLTLLVATVALLTISALASLWPATRVGRISPALALRVD